ncbi:SCO6880 family protein [Streptomyces sp. NPDC091376]|uniref:SCO6880 family protein n=1 Tax=Streptomyces sp. NPDC091376 TaxID=3365994 RepID=UPI00382CB81F
MSQTVAARPTYGNWRLPRRPGVGPLGPVGTVGAFVGLVLVLLASLSSLYAALVTLVAVLVPILPLAVRTRDGRSLYQLAAVRIGWALRTSSGSHTYVSGPLSNRPDGRFSPPGLLAGVRALDGRDTRNRPFGVLCHGRDRYTVVLACEPNGGTLVDPDQVDLWVAAWGQWLARLGLEPGLHGASVVVDTAPDTGVRLAHEVLPRITPHAPPAARAVMEELVRQHCSASYSTSTYIALTFGPVGRRRGTRHMVDDLAVRMKGLVAGLAESGGGAAHPLSAERIAEVVRVAYDPAAAAQLPEAATRPGGSGLRWDDAGPSAAVESVSSYAHDSGVSRTWMLTEAPRGTVHSGVLRSLLEPVPGVRRKRVALLYRPIDQALSARIVEADRRAAHFTASAGWGMVRARASAEVRAAEQVAAEEAAGAGLVEFSMLLTVTVDTVPDLPEAALAVAGMQTGSRLSMRPADRMQAAAFACSLPVGILPWEHTLVPFRLREAL